MGIEHRRDEHLVRLVFDQGDDHAVEVEKEHDEVEPELDERLLRGGLASLPLRRLGLQKGFPYLLVHIKLAEDLSRVEKVGVVDNPIALR